MLPVLLLSSCGDKRLEEQAKEQAGEITTLQARIAALESELSTMPPDVTPALEEARAKLKEQLEQTAKLEGEVNDLEARKAKLEKTLEETKRKYPLGSPFPRPTQTR
jgi:outer membrane murein-binding lipoprotein Lpp